MWHFSMESKQFKNRITETVGMPKDVIYGVPMVTLTGHSEMFVSNYRGILEYTEQLIRVQTKLGRIHVTGKSLQIEYYNNDEMKIIGHINTLEYL